MCSEQEGVALRGTTRPSVAVEAEMTRALYAVATARPCYKRPKPDPLARSVA